ncbi:MAG: hypothetical protein ACPG7K_03600 [Poseidonia sp.]
MKQPWYCASFTCKAVKRRIETGRRVLKRAGGLRFSGEIDGRAFFDLRLEHG